MLAQYSRLVVNFVVNIGADIDDWLCEVANFVVNMFAKMAPIFMTKCVKSQISSWILAPIFATKFATSRAFDRIFGREFISSTYAVFLTCTLYSLCSYIAAGCQLRKVWTIYTFCSPRRMFQAKASILGGGGGANPPPPIISATWNIS